VYFWSRASPHYVLWKSASSCECSGREGPWGQFWKHIDREEVATDFWSSHQSALASGENIRLEQRSPWPRVAAHHKELIHKDLRLRSARGRGHGGAVSGLAKTVSPRLIVERVPRYHGADLGGGREGRSRLQAAVRDALIDHKRADKVDQARSEVVRGPRFSGSPSAKRTRIRKFSSVSFHPSS
jgi:hypothetical protein